MIQCDHCSSMFTDRNNELKCAHCELSCTHKDSLTRHIQSKHLGTLKRKSELEPEKTKRKRYYVDHDIFKWSV